MKQLLRSLVVIAAVGLGACGGKASNSDGGTAGSAGGAAGSGAGAAGRGGTGGASGAAGSGPAGTTGAGGSASGAAGNAGAAGSAGGSGGSTGGGGAAGAVGGAGASGGRGGSGGNAGAGGSAGRGGAGGAAGTGGELGGSCTAPTDCAGTPIMDASGYCGAPAWSCVDGKCAWECMGGRTCVEAPDSGCLRCRMSPSDTPISQGCVGTPCLIDPAKISMVTQLNCQSSPPPDFSTWHCTGSWATLAGSGAACTIESVASGLFRVSVTCGACVTIVGEN
jgi:hypothetical protein